MCGSSSMIEQLSCGPASRCRDRNGERERRSAARLGLHAELAAVRFDDPPRDGQAEAGAAGRRVRHLHERLEDLGEVLARNARRRCRSTETATSLAATRRGDA